MSSSPYTFTACSIHTVIISFLVFFLKQSRPWSWVTVTNSSTNSRQNKLAIFVSLLIRRLRAVSSAVPSVVVLADTMPTSRLSWNRITLQKNRLIFYNPTITNTVVWCYNNRAVLCFMTDPQGRTVSLSLLQNTWHGCCMWLIQHHPCIFLHLPEVGM